MAASAPNAIQVCLRRIEARDEAPDCLSAAEKARAERFRLPEDRRRYLQSRALLRTVLGARLNVAPERLVIAPDVNGRPVLDPPNAVFSLAHSGRFALIAVQAGGRLGVDIEDLNLRRDLPLIAKALLTPADLERWRALPRDEAQQRLLRAWTREEAVGKAIGSGLPMTEAQRAAAFAGPEALGLHDLSQAGESVATLATSLVDPTLHLDIV